MGVLVVRPEEVRAFGANAALLLAQVDYWLKRPNARCIREDRDGRWCGQARAEWQLQLGLTAQQLRLALESLVGKGVLVRRRHLHLNRVTAFLRIDVVARDRLVSGAQPHTGRGVSTQTGLGEKNQIDLGESTASIKDRDCIKTEERIGSVPEQSFLGGLNQENSGRENMPPKSKIGISVKGVAAGMNQARSAQVDPSDASKPGQLASVFKHAWADTYQDFLPSFTGAQLGQLKQIQMRGPAGAAGPMLDWIVRNWPVFVSAASQREGAFDAPSLPTPGFILRFLQSAVNCWQEHSMGGVGGVTSAPASPAHKPAKPMKVPQPEEKMPEAQSDKVTDPDEVYKQLSGIWKK